MTGKGLVEINNCPYDSGIAVVRVVAGKLWYFGRYETPERAEDVARELGDDAIVVRLDGKCKKEDCISRGAVEYYIQSHINEIITESGADKNAHTNAILRALVNGIKTMPTCCEAV